jgi:membrane protein YdbS with pleckstrin-like domain
MNQLSPRAIFLFGTKNLFYYLLPGLFVYAFSAVISSHVIKALFDLPENTLNALGVIMGFIGYIIFCHFIAWLWMNNYSYQLDEKTIKIESGIIRKKMISIPYSRIQDLSIRRGPLARLLGLSRLEIQTAGGSFGAVAEAKIDGLDTKSAEVLRTKLMEAFKMNKNNL